jgi:flagellar basal body-associated protein FliL
MNIIQLVLIFFGLAIAAGGVFMLFRAANADRRAEAAGQSVRPRPYVPLGVVAVGLIIAYHSFTNYSTFQSSDITILFLFALALATLLGLRFFLADKTDLPPTVDEARKTNDESHPNSSKQ